MGRCKKPLTNRITKEILKLDVQKLAKIIETSFNSQFTAYLMEVGRRISLRQLEMSKKKKKKDDDSRNTDANRAATLRRQKLARGKRGFGSSLYRTFNPVPILPTAHKRMVGMKTRLQSRIAARDSEQQEEMEMITIKDKSIDSSSSASSASENSDSPPNSSSTQQDDEDAVSEVCSTDLENDNEAELRPTAVKRVVGMKTRLQSRLEARDSEQQGEIEMITIRDESIGSSTPASPTSESCQTCESVDIPPKSSSGQQDDVEIVAVMERTPHPPVTEKQEQFRPTVVVRNPSATADFNKGRGFLSGDEVYDYFETDVPSPMTNFSTIETEEDPEDDRWGQGQGQPKNDFVEGGLIQPFQYGDDQRVGGRISQEIMLPGATPHPQAPNFNTNPLPPISTFFPILSQPSPPPESFDEALQVLANRAMLQQIKFWRPL